MTDATTPPTSSPPAEHRPLDHAALLELRDLLHLPEFSVAAGLDEIDAWLQQLDIAIDRREIDPRPSWVLQEEAEADRLAAKVAEKLGPVLAVSADEVAAAVASRLAAAPLPTESEGDNLLDRQQLADVLGVSRATVDRLRKRPGFPAHRVGDAPRFVAGEVRRWLGATEGGTSVGLRLLPGAK